MSAKAVFDISSKIGGSVAEKALDVNANAIMDFTFAAQAREYRFEAAPSVAPSLKM